MVRIGRSRGSVPIGRQGDQVIRHQFAQVWMTQVVVKNGRKHQGGDLHVPLGSQGRAGQEG